MYNKIINLAKNILNDKRYNDIKKYKLKNNIFEKEKKYNDSKIIFTKIYDIGMFNYITNKYKKINDNIFIQILNYEYVKVIYTTYNSEEQLLIYINCDYINLNKSRINPSYIKASLDESLEIYNKYFKTNNNLLKNDILSEILFHINLEKFKILENYIKKKLSKSSSLIYESNCVTITDIDYSISRILFKDLNNRSVIIDIPDELTILIKKMKIIINSDNSILDIYIYANKPHPNILSDGKYCYTNVRFEELNIDSMASILQSLKLINAKNFFQLDLKLKEFITNRLLLRYTK